MQQGVARLWLVAGNIDVFKNGWPPEIKGNKGDGDWYRGDRWT